MRRGSVLVMALWIILVLSVMVFSFATEARIQSGGNVQVRERYRANRLIEAGFQVAEVILLNYSSAPEWTEDQDDEKLMEDDRWVLQKQDLQNPGGSCTTTLVLDDRDYVKHRTREGEDETSPDSVTIRIDPASSGQGVINVNKLTKDGGDAKYIERWTMIFRWCGIPEELDTEHDGTINLWNTLIASWDDWHDTDDNVTAMDGDECGAESKWYEDWEEKYKIGDGDKVRPRNGDIAYVDELSFVRGFRDYPAVLYGKSDLGNDLLNPWETDKKKQIHVKGILAENFFCTVGSKKINVNGADEKTLITIPGIYDKAEDDDALTEAMVNAQAILEGKRKEPDWTHDKKLDSWPYKDWSDLENRVEDVEIGSAAGDYLEYKADGQGLFRITVTGESMGITHSVRALCYVKDKTIRYVEWNEDDKETSDDEANQRKTAQPAAQK